MLWMDRHKIDGREHGHRHGHGRVRGSIGRGNGDRWGEGKEVQPTALNLIPRHDS